IAMLSRTCCSAAARTDASGLPNDPNLYSCDSKTFGLIDPGRTPKRLASDATSDTLLTAEGKSHSTCNARVGHAPVSLWISPASLNFSSSVPAAAACRNLPKRVPVLAKPHDGSSMWKTSSAAAIRSEVLVMMRHPAIQESPQRG